MSQLPNSNKAAKFLKLADGMNKAIEEKSRVPNWKPTYRRMSIDAGRAEDKRRLQTTQSTLQGLSTAWKDGTLSSHLALLTTKVQIEFLLFRSEYPSGEYQEDDRKMLAALNIYTNEEYQTARNALLAIGDPAAGQETTAEKVRKLEREIALSRIDGYFPTPPEVVEVMLNLAQIDFGQTVLEPSAGAGHIADAINALDVDIKLEVIEIHYDLRAILTLKGLDIVHYDFMEFAKDPKNHGKYDRIVMNPPFERGQDIDHVRAAYDLLAPDGALVSVMSNGTFFRKDKKATAFQEFYFEHNAMTIPLPEDAFLKSDRPTGVETCIVTITKYSEEPPKATPAPMPMKRAEIQPAAATPAPIAVTISPAVKPAAEAVEVVVVKTPVVAGFTKQDSMWKGSEVIQFGSKPKPVVTVTLPPMPLEIAARRTMPESEPQKTEPMPPVTLAPFDQIVAGSNDRKVFNQRKLEMLAKDIEENGFIGAIVLRRLPNGKLEIVCGERRTRAVRDILKWKTIPAMVYESLSDEKASAMMLAENTGREDLSPIEEAQGYEDRATKFKWSEQKIAEVAGVAVDRVRRRLTLLDLVPEVQELIATGNFPIGHAETLAAQKLDTNRQRIAFRLFRDSVNMPATKFRQICNDLTTQQDQQQLAGFEQFWLEQDKAAPIIRRGFKAKVNAPIRADIPQPQLCGGDDTAPEIVERYIKALLDLGKVEEAGAIGNLYTALVHRCFMAVPEKSILG